MFILPSLANARDLGGNVMPDGRRIRSGLLLRGGDLSRASDEDLAALSRKYRVAKVFDFRTSMEVRRAPDREVDGALNIWLPAFNEDSQTMAAMSLPQSAYLDLPCWLAAHASDPRVQDVASRLYTDMVIEEFTQIQYAGFLQNILNTEDGAVYWHCSQGKDRTGIGAAFLLAALGADRELIMRDYELSNVFYRNDVEKGYASVSTQEEREVILTFLGVNSRYFSAALDLIDREYGSMQNFLTGTLMLSGEDMETLRARYLY
ncbi:MAG: tyrosine-protein phosphatase [Bacteroidales bacterium]|nr:tyrosine-protein phosphatase [Bacteroidales bacterium]